MYNEKLALPGGKIEVEEHSRNAVCRKIEEETGLVVEVENFCGVVSEHLYSDGELENHFLINVFSVVPIGGEVKRGDEGDVGWYSVSRVSGDVVPSDLKMIELVKESKDFYFECRIEDESIFYFKSV